MKTDDQLKTDVEAELDFEPAINATGIVTLTGHLDTFAEKYAAEQAVRRVSGVRGIAIELDVKLAAEHKRSDSEIAQAASSALRWHSLVPDEHAKVEVQNGIVTLTGELDWGYQRSSAEQSVRSLLGVRGLLNRITIKAHANKSDIGKQIRGCSLRDRPQLPAEYLVGQTAVTSRIPCGTDRSYQPNTLWDRPPLPAEYFAGQTAVTRSEQALSPTDQRKGHHGCQKTGPAIALGDRHQRARPLRSPRGAVKVDQP